jgi:hypothetical protein
MSRTEISQINIDLAQTAALPSAHNSPASKEESAAMRATAIAVLILALIFAAATLG